MSTQGNRFQAAIDRSASEVKAEIKELADIVRPVGAALALIEHRVGSLERKQSETSSAIERLIRLEERLAGVISWGGNAKWIITTMIAVGVPIVIKLVWK